MPPNDFVYYGEGWGFKPGTYILVSWDLTAVFYSVNLVLTCFAGAQNDIFQ